MSLNRTTELMVLVVLATFVVGATVPVYSKTVARLAAQGVELRPVDHVWIFGLVLLGFVALVLLIRLTSSLVDWVLEVIEKKREPRK